MSYKTTFSSYSKSFAEKKKTLVKNAVIKSLSVKEEGTIFPRNKSLINKYYIIQKNLKKYVTTSRKYHTFIINSIIFDQRIHKVAVFKNNLLWDESSEFLKRYYKKRESVERIPKIAEYYEKYTLFPPVYFGLEGLIIIIMNKWTKRKKSYLEYIEDHEEEREERKKHKKKDKSFEPLINSSLINNKTSSKSIMSKNTLDLSKFDNELNKNNINKNNFTNNNFNKKAFNNNNDKKKRNLNSLSFSEIMDDLSSQYSVIINNTEGNKQKNKENPINKKYQKDQNSLTRGNLKKEGRNDNIINKVRNSLNYNAKTLNNHSKIYNKNKPPQLKSIDSPKKSIKICLNKKNNKFILINNNNANIIKRNSMINNMQPSETKKYQKRVMNTDNNLHKTHEIQNSGNLSTKNNTKGAIRVNTISNYTTDKSKIINNNVLKKNNTNTRNEINSSKKMNNNNIIHNQNNIKKSSIINNNKKVRTYSNAFNFVDKNINTKNNTLKKNLLK